MSAPTAAADLHVLIAGMFRASLNASLYATGVQLLEAGMSLADLADGLALTEAFAALYTPGDKSAYANELATGLLGLPPGYDFAATDATVEFRAARDWIAGLLDAGLAPGQAACAAIEALATSTAGAYEDGRLRLEHQAEVAQYYVARGGAAETLPALQAVLAGVTADAGSVNLAMAAIDLATDGGTAETPDVPNEWTVMVYMAADNDLEPFAFADLNEMEAALLPAGVSVLAGVDRIAGYDASDGDWTDARIGVIGRDGDTSLVSGDLASVGEVNTGAAATLTGFIDWAVQERPAQHYALVIWNHGDGVNGVGFDASSGDDALNFREIQEAIAASIPGELDFVGFDACSMAMLEQAHALVEVADYMVAAEDQEPAEGWNYADWLSAAFAPGAAADAGDLAHAAVASFGGQYADQGDATLSALALDRIPAVAAALQTFVQASAAGSAADWGAIDAAYYQATYFGASTSVDLRDFAASLAGRPGLSAALTSAAENLVTVADIAVTAATVNMAGTYGLSIYWPAHRPYDFVDIYSASDVALLGSVAWDGFLQDYWSFV
jgi:hypothetical protein